MGNDSDTATSRSQSFQHRVNASTQITEAFAVRRAVCRQLGWRQWSKIGQSGMRKAFPVAEILFP